MIFLTGCDKNTEWQLPWFVDNFKTHTDLPLVIADFGMSEVMRDWATTQAQVFDCETNGWFTKVEAMIRMGYMYGQKKFCWVDTDCQICSDPSGIFSYVQPNKLTMIIDHPWSTRRPQLGHWYNSGVVAYESTPNVLLNWQKECRQGNHRGDQEALYSWLGGDFMKIATYISEAPHRYNTLRIDLIDKTAPKNPIIMHWTGEKGNDEIRNQMK